jgi:hypothetical protein
MTQKNKIFSTIGNLLRYSYHATFFSISVIFASLFYYFKLCRHFRMKMQHLGKKEKIKWELLACKVLETKGTISSITARRKLTSKAVGS